LGQFISTKLQISASQNPQNFSIKDNNTNVLINIQFYIRKLTFIFENNIFLPLDFRNT